MKKLISLIASFGCIILAMSQASSVCISAVKTISLVFPFPVTHVDRGSKDILVQQVKEAANILLVKAAARDIPETNLSVVTDEGSIYSLDRKAHV